MVQTSLELEINKYTKHVCRDKFKGCVGFLQHVYSKKLYTIKYEINENDFFTNTIG